MKHRNAPKINEELHVTLNDGELPFVLEKTFSRPRHGANAGDQHLRFVFSNGYTEDKSAWVKLRRELAILTTDNGRIAEFFRYDNDYLRRRCLGDRVRRMHTVLQYILGQEAPAPTVFVGHSEGTAAIAMALHAEHTLPPFVSGFVALNPVGLAKNGLELPGATPEHRDRVARSGLVRTVVREGLAATWGTIADSETRRAVKGIALNGIRTAIRGNPFEEGEEILTTPQIPTYLGLAGDGLRIAVFAGTRDRMCPGKLIGESLASAGFTGDVTVFDGGTHSSTLTDPAQLAAEAALAVNFASQQQ